MIVCQRVGFLNYVLRVAYFGKSAKLPSKGTLLSYIPTDNKGVSFATNSYQHMMQYFHHTISYILSVQSLYFFIIFFFIRMFSFIWGPLNSVKFDSGFLCLWDLNVTCTFRITVLYQKYFLKVFSTTLDLSSYSFNIFVLRTELQCEQTLPYWFFLSWITSWIFNLGSHFHTVSLKKVCSVHSNLSLSFL